MNSTKCVVVWQDHENNDISAERFASVEDAKSAIDLDEDTENRKAILVKMCLIEGGEWGLDVEYFT